MSGRLTILLQRGAFSPDSNPGRFRLRSTVRRLLNGELKPYCADWGVDVDEGAVLVRLR